MSYKLKTLVVFDTNSLRSTEAGEVAYSFFAFGRPFQVIENFIIENNLAEDIHIAIPTWAIEELKDQKQRQYKTDILEFQKLAKRLSGLPHIPEIALPEAEFDCAAYIEEKALAYLDTKQVKRLEIKEEIANTVLRSMMTRVMKDEGKKKPFAHSGKYKDAGFKDNVVWESLMHYESVIDYDKIIFLTKDGDYKNCEIEFKEKWNRHIAIWQDENNVLADVQKDYDNYIKERVIHDFAQTDYFKDYLNDELKVLSTITIDDKDFAIENYQLKDLCSHVERMPPNEEGEENINIHSLITFHYTQGNEKKTQEVKVKTTLSDDFAKSIVSTEYDFELE